VRWFPTKQERDEIDERLLPTALRDQQLASRRVPLWLRLVVLISPLVYAGYSIITFTGPARFFAEIQARILDGSHVVQLTWLLTVLVCLIPALLVMFTLRRMFPMTAEELERERHRLPRATARHRDLPPG
jgi:hypothetical protein